MAAHLLRFFTYALTLVLILGATGLVYWNAGEQEPDPGEPAPESTGLGVLTQALSGSGPELLAAAASPNGFDVSNATVPRQAIRRGGPPRDGIPALLDPKFTPAAEADYLRPGDKVVGVARNGEARAYPLRILVWHEIVNDKVGDVPVAVTYCPLCGTAMVFDRRQDERVLTFGVSGLLYNSDVLMYDHQTESLWSQLKMEAISGPMAEATLAWLPSRLMNWEAWRKRHPDGKVLSTDTGYARNYARTPYEGYERDEQTFFPYERNRDDLGVKTWVVGVRLGANAKAYPLEALERVEGNAVSDTVGGVPVRIRYRPDADEVVVTRTDTGEHIASVRAYWFAWQAFYPETGLYRGEASAS